jgi:predicted Zn-dependent peptidase
MAMVQPARAELDLRRAEVSRLANGLTVIVLEDHSFPVVSTQMLYKSGSRDETAGKTGLAHFLEHLAFRASENFPNAGATEAIYDAGGEWHGYTWLDQTTYFSTMPAAGLDLLLRIEADRMARVTIDPAAMDAEKGAVITEMHSYENDPASVLLDAVTATALQAHPYRNNTIGYESDVAALTIDDARDFYRTHYSPANAVLAIVGDVKPGEAKALVSRYFGGLAARAAPARVASVEPVQRGERRTNLAGPVDRQYFQVAFPAPAASSPDFPVFLVLQQLLSGGSGVNFRQNDWGTPARAGSLLHGMTDDTASWFIPTADRYVFTVKGSLAAGADQSALERGLERRMASLRARPPSGAQLASAKAAVARQLAEDVESTEDAAHQLAYFEGIGAYDALVVLPRSVAAVSAEQVQRAAQNYLAPEFRTIGWYVPGTPPGRASLGQGAPAPAAPRPGTSPSTNQAPEPQLRRLAGGLPVIVQESPLSPAVTVELVLSAPVTGEEPPRDLPGLGRVVRSGPAVDLPTLIAEAAKAAQAAPLPQMIGSEDPETRIQQMIANETVPFATQPVQPMVAIVSGAVTPKAAFAALERALGQTRPAILPPPPARPSPHQKVIAQIDRPLSQGALGYVVAAPPSASREGLAWRMLLYIVSHDYSGRLGRSAIGEQGLAYHIASDYRTDGRRGWVTLSTGVDPAKADAMEAELKRQLAALATNPPTAAEVEAARRHLLGCDISAAQTNEEIADRLARQFVETGGLRTHEQLKAMLDTITRADVAAAVPAFSRGTILRVDARARTPR